MEISRVACLSKSNRRAHNFPDNGVFLAVDRHLCDFRHFVENAFDFRRVHLLATHVNNFRLTPENMKILAVYFDFVASIELPVSRERTWCVEVTKHRGLGFYLKDSVNDPCLKTFATKLHPKGIRGA